MVLSNSSPFGKETVCTARDGAALKILQASPLLCHSLGPLSVFFLSPLFFFLFKNYFIVLIVILFIFIFWHCGAACGILVPQPGIESVPLALEAQS